MAELICPHCGGEGSLNDPYDFYDVDTPDQCHWCKGTGMIHVVHTPPLAARQLLVLWGVEAAELTEVYAGKLLGTDIVVHVFCPACRAKGIK